MQENSIQYKAVVLGGTGLIGNELLKYLIADNSFSQIHLIGRKDSQLTSSKIHFHQINMDELLNYSHLFNVDVVFCCLGTTIKTAGSKEAFLNVDFNMITNAAKNASKNSSQFIVISSIGANKNSSNFYLKTKGQTEEVVLQQNIPSISILRPSILFGDRKENRTGEKIGIIAMKIAAPILIGSLKKYRGNEAANVALSMIKLAKQNVKGAVIYESTQIEEIAKS